MAIHLSSRPSGLHEPRRRKALPRFPLSSHSGDSVLILGYLDQHYNTSSAVSSIFTNPEKLQNLTTLPSWLLYLLAGLEKPLDQSTTAKRSSPQSSQAWSLLPRNRTLSQQQFRSDQISLNTSRKSPVNYPQYEYT
jgi:hypothetical protein